MCVCVCVCACARAREDACVRMSELLKGYLKEKKEINHLSSILEA